MKELTYSPGGEFRKHSKEYPQQWYHWMQGGRTWQAFGGGKNGHETFRQARMYNFRDKCDVFARNRKFANLTQ